MPAGVEWDTRMKKVLKEKLFVVKVSLAGGGHFMSVRAFHEKKHALEWIKNADQYDYVPGDVFQIVEKTTYERVIG